MRSGPIGWALLAGVACGRHGDAAVADAPRMALAVAKPKVAEGEAVHATVTLSLPDGWSAEAPAPTAQGLEVTAGKAPNTWDLSGPKGSYVVSLPAVEASDALGIKQALKAEPVFVDIGVSGPSGGPMDDFAAIPPPAPFPWAIAGAAALIVGAVTAAGVMVARRPKPVPPPEPPDERARRLWAEARAAGLDDHTLAVRLSYVLRDYLDVTTGLRTTTATTVEILEDLRNRGMLAPALEQRAAHVLDATDRLKFAREGGGGAFFDELGQDFDVVVRALRPAPPANPTAKGGA